MRESILWRRNKKISLMGCVRTFRAQYICFGVENRSSIFCSLAYKQTCNWIKRYKYRSHQERSQTRRGINENAKAISWRQSWIKVRGHKKTSPKAHSFITKSPTSARCVCLNGLYDCRQCFAINHNIKQCPYTVRSGKLSKLREKIFQKRFGSRCNSGGHKEALNSIRTWNSSQRSSN